MNTFFKAAVFIPAFMLFQFEFMCGKALLPVYGGSYYTWAGCLLFFQMILLAGYFYSHHIFRFTHGMVFHRVFLGVSLFCLSLRFSKTVFFINPFFDLLIKLALFGAVPFFILCTATTTLQQLYIMKTGREPYFLFGWSNAGSVVGLLSYPLITEPFFDIETQFLIFNCCYAGYVIFSLILFSKEKKAVFSETETSAIAFSRILWILLSASSCALMVAVTNIITLDIAPVPLLWMLPLLIYLLSFVFSFGGFNISKNALILAFLVFVVVISIIITQNDRLFYTDITTVIAVHSGVLFFICMMLNLNLYDSRPLSHLQLGDYYRCIAFGGFLGTFFISFLMPVLARDTGVVWLDYAVGFFVSVLSLYLFSCRKIKLKKLRYVSAAFGVIFICIISFYIVYSFYNLNNNLVFSLRNFYGCYKVVDIDETRKFFHGSTNHGSQHLNPKHADKPISYYGPKSGLSDILEIVDKREHVGIVGLGAGVIAGHARANEYWDFYELDPDVIKIAQTYFSYLKNCVAQIRLIAGDGRKKLEEQSSVKYDVLVLDAFCSDSVPVHLLTREAVKLYSERLNPNGVIVFNITNRHFNLLPILQAVCLEQGYSCLYKRNIIKDKKSYELSSVWLVITKNRELEQKLSEDWDNTGAVVYKKIWTDRYSNVLEALGWM